MAVRGYSAVVVSPWLTLAVSIIGAILIPVVILLWKAAVNSTRQADKIEELAKDLHELVDDKDKVHERMYSQMREDRQSTDRRLRWLEEHLWRERS